MKARYNLSPERIARQSKYQRNAAPASSTAQPAVSPEESATNETGKPSNYSEIDPAVSAMVKTNRALLAELSSERQIEEIELAFEEVAQVYRNWPAERYLELTWMAPAKLIPIVESYVPEGCSRSKPELFTEILFLAAGRRDALAFPNSHCRVLHRGYMLAVLAWPKIEEWEYAQRLKKQEEREIKFRSEFCSQEPGVGLSPAMKSKVLRTGLAARNRIGFVDEDGFRTNHLSYGKEDIAAARRFFEENPAWSAADIIRIMERCSQLAESSEDGMDPFWHARKGSNLRMALCNLESILQQLELTDCPDLVPMGKEELYPTSKRSKAEPGAETEDLSQNE